MVEKRYHTLRFVASIQKLLGIFILFVGLMAGLSAAVAAIILNMNLMASLCWYPACSEIAEPFGSLLIVGSIFLLGLILFLLFFGTGEFLNLLISIEENTRRTAFVLRMSLATTPAQVAAAG